MSSYFISTPYIDAYEHDWEHGHPKLDYDDFVLHMKGQAYDWGEQAVGRALIQGHDPATHDGRYVLAFGTHGDKKYLATAVGNDIQIEEVDSIPNEWNVT